MHLPFQFYCTENTVFLTGLNCQMFNHFMNRVQAKVSSNLHYLIRWLTLWLSSCLANPFHHQQLKAISTFSSVGSRSSEGMRMHANKRECMRACTHLGVCVCVCVCVYGINFKCPLHWHIRISVHSVACQSTRTLTVTHILKPFEDHKSTGLKMVPIKIADHQHI